MADHRVKPTFEVINDKRAALQAAYIRLDHQTRVLTALQAADETAMLTSDNWQTSSGLQSTIANDIVVTCWRIVALAHELDGREGSGSASQG